MAGPDDPPRTPGPGHHPTSAWIEGGVGARTALQRLGAWGTHRPTQCASPPRPLRARLPVLHREVSDETDEKNPLHISRFYFFAKKSHYILTVEPRSLNSRRLLKYAQDALNSPTVYRIKKRYCADEFTRSGESSFPLICVWKMRKTSQQRPEGP